MKKKRRKKTIDYEEDVIEQNEYFYFIAGYTEGGIPYGITWEEAEEQGLSDEMETLTINKDEDLPF